VQLNQDRQAFERIEALLLAHYRTMVPDSLLDEIERIMGRLDSQMVEEAVARHVEDTTLDGRNMPVGKFPPSIADLTRHYEQQMMERRREEQQRKNIERQKEPRNPSVAKRVLVKVNWDELVRGYAEKRRAITAALRQQLHLTWKDFFETMVLAHTIKAWMDSGAKMTPAEAVEVARRYIEQHTNPKEEQHAIAQ